MLIDPVLPQIEVFEGRIRAVIRNIRGKSSRLPGIRQHHGSKILAANSLG
jgi:hypothetical protein